MSILRKDPERLHPRDFERLVEHLESIVGDLRADLKKQAEHEAGSLLPANLHRRLESLEYRTGLRTTLEQHDGESIEQLDRRADAIEDAKWPWERVSRMTDPEHGPRSGPPSRDEPISGSQAIPRSNAAEPAWALKYRRKPTEIFAVEFRPSDVSWRAGSQGCAIGELYGAQIRSGTIPGKGFEVWNERHDSWIGLDPGDYLRVGDDRDVYPIDASTFEETYERVEGESV